jgi:hypothetical protein
VDDKEVIGIIVMKIKIDHLYIREKKALLYDDSVDTIIQNESDECVVRMSLDDVGKIVDNYIEIDADKLRKNGERIYKDDDRVIMPNEVYYIICIGDINCRVYYPDGFFDLAGYSMPVQNKLSVSEWVIKKLLE